MTLLSPPQPPAAPAAPAAPEGVRARIALYGHDTLGLGHLRRNLALAEHLGARRGGADVLLVTSAPEASRFPLPDGVELLVLPSVRKDAAGRYASGHWQQGLADVVELRRRLLATALDSFAPDLLVVDKCPWGFRDELEPALRHLRARGTRLVLGLRDVLDDPAAASAQWLHDRGDDAVEDCYDEVWVYGDPSVHDVAAAAAMAPAAASACRYLGYLAAGRVLTAERPDGVDGPFVLALCGGGSDGAALAGGVPRCGPARRPHRGPRHGAAAAGPRAGPPAGRRPRPLRGRPPPAGGPVLLPRCRLGGRRVGGGDDGRGEHRRRAARH